MTPARIVFLLVGAVGALISALAIAGIDQAVLFGLLDPGVDFHTRDAGGRLGFGIVGGVMVGWSITCDGLIHGHDPGRTLRRGTIAWFVLDSAASLATGMWPNVLFNVLFLVPMVGVSLLPAAPRIEGVGR